MLLNNYFLPGFEFQYTVQELTNMIKLIVKELPIYLSLFLQYFQYSFRLLTQIQHLKFIFVYCNLVYVSKLAQVIKVSLKQL